ncbi:MAG: hypothetical protein Q7R30_11090 [Acidobacteriota bacterium]|nr:hypothetical protein [Acidobacteriota bacterium]
MDFAEIIRDAEDRLFPNRALDVWERALYYQLIRRTHVDGLSGAVVPIDPLSKTSGMSTTKVREILRSLHDKGCMSSMNVLGSAT